jgi:hypothetical protein
MIDMPVSNLLPVDARQLLIRASKTHSPTEIDAAILAVRKMYPQLFKKDDEA